MNKIKMIGRSLKIFVKKHWLICTGSLAFGLLLLMFLPVCRSSWLYFPDSLKARIALKKLAAASETAYYCREDCSATRLLYQNIIRSDLAKEKEKLWPDLESVIINIKVLPEVRSSLIKIWQDSGAKPSEKIKNVYTDSNQPFELRAQLADAWPELVDSSFYYEIVGNFKTASDDKSREAALDLLINKNDPIIISLIWKIILGDYSDVLKNKAFFLLANINDKKTAYQTSDVDSLRAVLESGDFPHRVKDQAILALGDYYDFYPEASEQLLSDVVSRTKYFDNYQRSFAIDILNRRRAIKLTPPELSQVDWDLYFTN